MASMVLGDSTLESLTPSVNVPYDIKSEMVFEMEHLEPWCKNIFDGL